MNITLEQAIDIIKKNAGEYKIYGNELVCECFYCHSPKHKFYLNLETGLFDCKLGSCKAHGNINHLLAHIGIQDRVPYDSEHTHEKDDKPFYINVDTSHFTSLSPDDYLTKYMESRGISLETLNKYNVLKDLSGNKLVFLTKKDDKIVNATYRTKDKLIFMEKGSRQALWGREYLDFSQDTINICEGRIDCLTLMEMGIDNVVSMPNGCSSHDWITLEWDLLSRFKNIVLCYDNDEAGKRGLDVAKSRLDFAMLYEVELGKYKDINDAYMKDSGFLYKQIRTPKAIELDGFISLENVSTSDGVNTELYSCGVSQFDRILGGVRLGESTIITASSGTGKSCVLCNMVKGILSQGEKCAVYSGELTNASLKAWIYSVIGGKKAVDYKDHPYRQGEYITYIKQSYEEQIDKTVKGKLYVYDGGKSDGYLMLKHFSQLNKRFGVKFFFIDNLSILSTSVKGMGQYEGEEHFSRALAEFCRSHKAHVFLFAHPTKQTLNSDPEYINNKTGKVKPIQRYDQYNIRGSASFANLAHNIMFLMRAKEHEKAYFIQKLGEQLINSGNEKEFSPLKQILQEDFSLFAYLVKNRGCGKTGEDVLFGYDSDTRRIYGLMSKEKDLEQEVEIQEEESIWEV